METVTYREIPCKSALHKLKRKIPYGWDLNIYRGCEHGCLYCYARSSHQYLDGDFCRDIHVKKDISSFLERELAAPGWKREVVNIGGVTDSYQPAEKEYRLMPEILKLLIQHKTPAIISTKSDLVLRDYDLIDELSRLTYVNVAVTVTTMDEGLRQLLEPGGVPSRKRFAVLEAFRQTNASTGLHMMPIIPYLTDTFENIDAILCRGKDARVHYVLPGTLYLRGDSRRSFFSFLETFFPEICKEFFALYQTGGAGKEYKDNLYQMVNACRKRYDLNSSYTRAMKEKMPKEGEQLSFF